MMWGWHEDNTPEYPYIPATQLNNHAATGAAIAPATLNTVTTPLSSERSTTYALKNEDDDIRDNSLGNGFGGSIAPGEIALDPFAALMPSPRPRGSDRPQISVPGLQWGSDPNFKFTGYSSTGKEHASKEDILAQRAMAMLIKEADSLNNTAVNTAINSPNDTRTAYSGIAKEVEEETLVSPSKRRKSFHRKQSEEDDQESSSSSPQPKATAKVKATAKKDLASPTGKSKKKKKASAVRRENLSEAQKRENHIQSEQKRRNLIREGFDDLCGLVPELRGGGYSKSAILLHAASYLEQIEEGNRALQMRVKQLGGIPA